MQIPFYANAEFELCDNVHVKNVQDFFIILPSKRTSELSGQVYELSNHTLLLGYTLFSFFSPFSFLSFINSFHFPLQEL